MKTALVVLFLLYSLSHSWTISPPRLYSRRWELLSEVNQAEQWKEEAQKLRDEIAAFEEGKNNIEEAERSEKEEELERLEARRARYSAVVPILKPDGCVVEERCDFSPFWKEEDQSYITATTSNLPLGLILGESEQFSGAICVDEATDDAPLQVGDLLRAFTACRMEMTQPTWQLVVGGIGQPKTVRFMYSADYRPFEEVMDAIGSNRMDPREMVLVVERRKIND